MPWVPCSGFATTWGRMQEARSVGLNLIAATCSDEELLVALAETTPAMLWLGDAEGKCVFLNTALRRFWGVDPQNLAEFDWSATLHPDDIDMLAGPFADAMARRVPFTVQARYRRADGAYRTMRTEANPRFAADGTFKGMTGVNTDISDQLAFEEHNQLLMGELNHRTKNLLAVVQAVARQTAQNVSPEHFMKTLEDRLAGLAASNDLLLKGDWSGVQLADLVDVQLAHVKDMLGTRLLASGPTLRVPSQGAQVLGMALHELSTNSLKYGALSHADGRVELNWSVSADEWHIEWRETNPVPIAEPVRKGFGHRVIVDMVASTLEAEVDIAYEQKGLRWRARIPNP